MKQKIWIILCEYRQPNIEDKQVSLIDMVLIDTPSTINQQTNLIESTIQEYTALHANYFKLMGMIDPKIVPYCVSLITTDIGRLQLIQFVENQITTEMTEKDFEILFDQVDKRNQN